MALSPMLPPTSRMAERPALALLDATRLRARSTPSSRRYSPLAHHDVASDTEVCSTTRPYGSWADWKEDAFVELRIDCSCWLPNSSVPSAMIVGDGVTARSTPGSTPTPPLPVPVRRVRRGSRAGMQLLWIGPPGAPVVQYHDCRPTDGWLMQARPHRHGLSTLAGPCEDAINISPLRGGSTTGEDKFVGRATARSDTRGDAGCNRLTDS